MRTVGRTRPRPSPASCCRTTTATTLAWSDEPLIPVVYHDGKGGVDRRRRGSPPIRRPGGAPTRRTRSSTTAWRAAIIAARWRSPRALRRRRQPRPSASTGCSGTSRRTSSRSRAPVYPRAIDAALAAEGKADLHRATAPAATARTRAIPPTTRRHLSEPAHPARRDRHRCRRWRTWASCTRRSSSTGTTARSTERSPARRRTIPFPGYMPPPLDGIWATAPYLHNGSVPTVELVLNSKARPAVWKRVDLDSTHFDEDALGWPWAAAAVSAGGGAGGGAEARLRHVVLEPVERRPHVRRSPDRCRTTRGDRVSEDAVMSSQSTSASSRAMSDRNSNSSNKRGHARGPIRRRATTSALR